MEEETTKICIICMGEKRKNVEILKERLDYYEIKYEILYKCINENKIKISKLIFIDEFDLDNIDNICNINPNIYSINYALYCFENEIPFNKLIYPIYNNCMKNIVICCTDINKKERKHIKIITKLLGGTFLAQLNSNVTHLLCSKVGSYKFLSAQKFNIPIIKYNYIFDLWKKCTNEDYNILTLPVDINQYLCKLFYGLCITLTGFNEENKEYIKNIIIQNDAKYSPNLIFSQSTHLIIGPNITNDKKILAAKNWNIPCIHIEWIKQSIQINKYLDWTNFIYKDNNNSPSLVNISLKDNQISHRNIFNRFQFYLSQTFHESKRFGLIAMINYMNGIICNNPSINQNIYFITDTTNYESTNIDICYHIHSDWIVECYKNVKLVDETKFLIHNYIKQSQTIQLVHHQDPNDKENKFQILQKQLETIKSTTNKNILYQTAHHHSTPYNQFSKQNDNILKIEQNNIFQLDSKFVHSQLTTQQPICYDDPIGKNERQKLLHLINNNDKLLDSNNKLLHNINNEFHTQYNSNLTHQNDQQKYSTSMPNLLINTSVTLYKIQDIKIMLSSFDPQTRIIYSNQVIKLGAELIDSDSYDSRCTHLITSTLTLSEKLICSLAAGKWILKPSYIDNSRILGTFPNEESHEWNNDQFNQTSVPCKFWRLNKQQTGNSSFYEWTVLLCLSQSKFQLLQNVLQAGQATITYEIIPSLTHVFLDTRIKMDRTHLKNISHKVYKPEFIKAYLLNKNIDSSKYLVKNI